MNHAWFRETVALMAELDADPDVRVVVLTGGGDRAFSAGGDIEDFNRIEDLEGARAQTKLALESFNAIERADTVVIAAVNGLAFGGGTELTVACDVALASTAARFAFKEVTWGLMPVYGLLRAPETIGRAWTHRLALSGDVIDAETALRIGLVTEVCEPDALVDTALALAARMAQHPGLALKTGKRFVNRASHGGLHSAIDAGAVLMAAPEREALTKGF
jgi:enoyl-CoA hydratase